MARSSLHYESTQAVKDASALTGMTVLSAQYPRYGYAKLRAIESEQPKIIARSFKEFSSRILKVEYINKIGDCCLRGHADCHLEDVGDYDIPEYMRKEYD